MSSVLAGRPEERTTRRGSILLLIPQHITVLRPQLRLLRRLGAGRSVQRGRAPLQCGRVCVVCASGSTRTRATRSRTDGSWILWIRRLHAAERSADPHRPDRCSRCEDAITPGFTHLTMHVVRLKRLFA